MAKNRTIPNGWAGVPPPSIWKADIVAFWARIFESLNAA